MDTNTDITPADISLLRLLPKRWPDRFHVLTSTMGFSLFVLGEKHPQDFLIFDHWIDVPDGRWYTHGTGLLTHALMEVAGAIMLTRIKQGGYRCRFYYKGTQFTKLHENPAIACLRAMAEMIEDVPSAEEAP